MTTIDLHGAANDLRSAHLLLLANHGELSNIQAGQVRDLRGVGATSWDGFPSDGIDRSRTQACNLRYLEAQVLLRSALGKLGARDKRSLESLSLPSELCDALGGIFDGVVLAQEMHNVAENRRLAHEVERAYDALRRSSPRIALAPLPVTSAMPEPVTRGDGFANAVGMAVGRHPQFWSTSQWLMLGVAVVAAMVFGAWLLLS
jgi:hypothetical protein